jgi:carboxyl-terminal processing protease
LITVPIKRELVVYDGVSKILFDKVGYVRLNAFSARTVPELKAALEDLSKRGARGLVIDLRDNHGGSFDAAVGATELLLPAGTPIVSVKKRGVPEEKLSAKGAPVMTPAATAVLVNHETSSGGELVTAALQEGLKAHVVGARTFGKWTVQTIDELPNGYAIKYTMSLFRTPSGKAYEGVGLTPDVEVDMDAKAAEKVQGITDPEKRLAADVQLRTALSLLKVKL